LLEETGIEFEIIEYLKTPLSSQQLEDLFKKIDGELAEFVRSSEAEFTALGFKEKSSSKTQLLTAMASHPKLMQRPIFETAQAAIIGRPPENVLMLV